MKFNDSYIGLRADLLKYISRKSCSVLDVGCATGVNGKWLLENGFAESVVGIEYDSAMALEAGKHYDRVYNHDLNFDSGQLRDNLVNQKFDYILLGDVLEHLIDPWTTLNLFANMLQPGGRIILSIPNIQHIDTFIHVFIKAYWPYNNRGIFDKTHLRFFTWKNIKDLVSGAGLGVLEMERVFRYRDALGRDFPFYGFLLKSLFKNLYTFQFIVVCERRFDSIGLSAPKKTLNK